MVVKRTYLYAFDKVMNVVAVKFLENDYITVQNLKRTANWMRATYPEDVVIYAIDNRPGLFREFQTVRKEGLRDFTKRVEFADIVSREGILL